MLNEIMSPVTNWLQRQMAKPVVNVTGFNRLGGHQRSSQPPAAGLSLSDLDMVMDQAYGSAPVNGQIITPMSALRVSAVWSCVQALADDWATLPIYPYRYSEAGGKTLAKDHYLWALLQHEANPKMTAFRFKHLMEVWRQTCGNAYAELEINGRGQVVGLWPWRPDRTRISIYEDQIWYTYRMADGTTKSVPQEEMLHLRGMSYDGLLGMSPIEMHKRVIGKAVAITEHGAKFFANGARPLGVLEHPAKLSDKAAENLRKWWKENHEGNDTAFRLAILEEGMKYAEVGMTMVDAQYLDSEKFSISDIARIFKVQPHKIGLLERSTNSNIEHQGLEYVQNTMGPIAKTWEEEIEFTCLSPRDRDTIFVRANFRHLLRGDMKSQAEFYTAMGNGGYWTQNEVREDQDMNPFPFDLANKPWKQGAMVPVAEVNTLLPVNGHPTPGANPNAASGQRPQPQPPSQPAPKPDQPEPGSQV